MVTRVSPQTLTLPAILDERAHAKLGKRLLQLFIRVHHDGDTPCNLQGPTGHQKKSDRFSSLDRNLVAAVEQYQRAVPDFIRQRGAPWSSHIGLGVHRVRRITKPCASF